MTLCHILPERRGWVNMYYLASFSYIQFSWSHFKAVDIQVILTRNTTNPFRRIPSRLPPAIMNGLSTVLRQNELKKSFSLFSFRPFINISIQLHFRHCLFIFSLLTTSAWWPHHNTILFRVKAEKERKKKERKEERKKLWYFI